MTVYKCTLLLYETTKGLKQEGDSVRSAFGKGSLQGQCGRDSLGQEEKQRDSKAAPLLVQASNMERSQGTDSIEEVELMPWQPVGCGGAEKGTIKAI